MKITLKDLLRVLLVTCAGFLALTAIILKLGDLANDFFGAENSFTSGLTLLWILFVCAIFFVVAQVCLEFVYQRIIDSKFRINLK